MTVSVLQFLNKNIFTENLHLSNAQFARIHYAYILHCFTIAVSFIHNLRYTAYHISRCNIDLIKQMFDFFPFEPLFTIKTRTSQISREEMVKADEFIF